MSIEKGKVVNITIPSAFYGVEIQIHGSSIIFPFDKKPDMRIGDDILIETNIITGEKGERKISYQIRKVSDCDGQS